MSKTKHISSFDIFDTCLVRTCGTPENFFDILSMQVFAKPVSENERQGFIIARREIEYKLYFSNPNANIFDIYNSFSYNHPYIISNNEILEKEMYLEKEVLVPVLIVKELINSLRGKGEQIIFVSDMYLPVEFLAGILKVHGIFQTGDRIFVSCDVGKTKFNGEIYRYIHEKENIPYNKWTHYGDNRRADIIEPQKLGIRTKQINHKYSTFEQDWINNGCVTLFKQNHILAGISRSLIYSLPDNSRKPLLIDVIAPVYSSFIGYIFEDASKRGISHLFFCARDTFQMFQVAKVFNKKYSNITIHYIRVSRKSLSESEPKILIKYFEQEGLASNNKTAIVDTTSAGHSFSIINNVLAQFGYNHCFAYFFIKWFEPTLNECIYYSAIRQRYINSGKITSIFKKLKIITLLENIFSANSEKRAIGYYEINKNIKPIYFEGIENEDSIQSNIDEMQEYHTNILTQYASIYINLGLIPYSFQILHHLAIPTFSQFAYYPTKEYTESLLNCYLKEDKKTLSYLKKESILRLLFTRGHDTCWSRATIFYNMPTWTHRLLLKYIDYKE